MRRRGFTLIELLIVVAIIAILALIAVPNFLEAQTRAKISRTANDMRTVAVGLESYRVDNNMVPPWDSWYGSNKIDRPGPLWIKLTSPIAYLSSIPRDIFVPANTIAQSGLGGSGSYGDLDVWIQVGVGTIGMLDANGIAGDLYVICSFCSDRDDNTNLTGEYPYSDSACPYDPTNGTISRGDLYRHSDRPPTNFLSSLNRGLSVTDNPWW
jgi:prepilin-type N-terminal cleavage/methylation domain-containing protein